jgi:hypothetical protein
MSLFDTNFADTASFLPKRAIGPFSATITLEEVASDELEITQHPVQQGASITDHAYNKPSTVNIKVQWNDDDAPLAETYQNLLDLQASREPFDVITGKRTYRNMLIKSLGQTNDVQTENILSISLQLQEIFITAVEVVSVPARPKQKNAGKTGATENAGQKSAQETPKKRSALAALAGKGG